MTVSRPHDPYSPHVRAAETEPNLLPKVQLPPVLEPDKAAVVDEASAMLAELDALRRQEGVQ